MAANNRLSSFHGPFPSYLVPVSKRAFVQNLSYENEFDLHENEPLGETDFHMNGFT